MGGRTKGAPFTTTSGPVDDADMIIRDGSARDPTLTALEDLWEIICFL